MTGSHSKGKTGKRYRYYRCRNADCRAVNVRGEQLETDFTAYLERLQPSRRAVRIFRSAVREVWSRRDGVAETKRHHLEERLAAARRRKQRLLDLVLDGTLDRETFKAEAESTEHQISELSVEVEGCESPPSLDLDDALDFATDVLTNAATNWQEFEAERRREFQILLFPDGVHYSHGREFGTPRKCCLFRGLEAVEGGKKEVVAPTGFEPVFQP